MPISCDGIRRGRNLREFSDRKSFSRPSPANGLRLRRLAKPLAGHLSRDLKMSNVLFPAAGSKL